MEFLIIYILTVVLTFYVSYTLLKKIDDISIFSITVITLLSLFPVVNVAFAIATIAADVLLT
jgi:hypothetical protein